MFNEIRKSQWPSQPENLNRVFKSEGYLVQEYIADGQIRLSINCVQMGINRWIDGISWDVLQGIKNKIGYGDKCAIEIYPPEKDLVNVANMRHLWIVEMPSFAWRNKKC